MTKEKSYFVAYRETDDKLQYSLGDEKSVQDFIQKVRSSEEIENFDNEESEENVFSDEGDLSQSLLGVLDFVLSHFHLLVLGAMLHADYPNQYVRRNVKAKLDEDCIEKTEDGEFALFEIDPHTRDELLEIHRNSQMIDKGIERMKPALFLGMVATFDALVSDLVGKMIRKNPGRLAIENKSIALNRVLQAECIEEVISEFVADELFLFSRGSHDEQTSYIEKNFNIGIREKWKRWPDFIEVFERRNLVAHGETSFTNRYADICSKHGHKGSEKTVGSEIELNTEYLLQSLDVLGEYGILLSFMLWRKHYSDDEQKAFHNLNEASYKLIQAKRYRLANRILEHALSLKGTGISENVRKMMVVNRASALRSDVSKDMCEEILDNEDWSASSWEFKISVAALKEDKSTFIDLLSEAKNSGFSVDNFRWWPVFRFIRDDEDINAALIEAYDESIAKPGRSAGKSVSHEKSSESDDKVH